MADPSTEGTDEVRTAELIGSLCLATDLGMGFPFEHGLQTTLIAMRLAERLGVDDVFFIGACSDIGDLLALAEVGVLSSSAEGLPNAVLEYMAAARPVVATAVGGVGEAVVDGETGYIVAAGDDRAMAERVISLLEDPELARAMGRRARRRTENQFSGRLLVERTVRLYDSVLDGRQR